MSGFGLEPFGLTEFGVVTSDSPFTYPGVSVGFTFEGSVSFAYQGDDSPSFTYAGTASFTYQGDDNPSFTYEG